MIKTDKKYSAEVYKTFFYNLKRSTNCNMTACPKQRHFALQPNLIVL